MSFQIRTNSAGVLRVSTLAFSGLPKLERLDLSGNYVRKLQPGALCSPDQIAARGPTKLRSLNLGRNDLRAMEDVGNLACLAGSLTSLDLSFNSLEMVGSNSLVRLGNLEELRLNNNHARNLKGDLLRAKPRLRFVDLSNNNLVSILNNFPKMVSYILLAVYL